MTPGAEPWAIPAGPGGNLWFTEFTGAGAGRITPAGVVSGAPAPISHAQES
jgi:streptogramin lyase